MVTYKINSDVLRGYGDFAAAGKRKEFVCPQQQGQVQNSLPNRKITTVDAEEFTREVLIELGYMDRGSSQRMDLKGLRKFVDKLDGKFGQISPEIKNTLSNALTDEKSLDTRSIFSVLGELDKLNRLVEDDNMHVTDDDFVVIEKNTACKQMKVSFAEKENHIKYENNETVNLVTTEKLTEEAGICEWAAGVYDQYVQYEPIFDNLLEYDNPKRRAGAGDEPASFAENLTSIFGKTCMNSLKDMRKMVTGTKMIKNGAGSAVISRANDKLQSVGDDVIRNKYSYSSVVSFCKVLDRLKQKPTASVSDFKKILTDLHIFPRKKVDDAAMEDVLERLKTAAAQMKAENLAKVPNLGLLYNDDGSLHYQDPNVPKFNDSHVNYDLTHVEWPEKPDYVLPSLFPLSKEIEDVDDLDEREQMTGEHFKEQIKLTLDEVAQLSKDEDIEVDQEVLGIFRDFMTTHADLVDQMRKFGNGEFDFTTAGGKTYDGNAIRNDMVNDVKNLDRRTKKEEARSYGFGSKFSSELAAVMGDKGLHYKTELIELENDGEDVWQDKVLKDRRKSRQRHVRVLELTDEEIRGLYIDGVKEKCKRAVGDHNEAVRRFFDCWRSARDVQEKKRLLQMISQVEKVDGKVSLSSLISKLASWELQMQRERDEKLKAEEQD